MNVKVNRTGPWQVACGWLNSSSPSLPALITLLIVFRALELHPCLR